ncbi:hypothetical protein JMM81_04660 [Bacillus sp. V3B]|uniref:hypothetical protein n=1 Tax=Bacillus sp. V3B TaxID=2804915 RepID=UPI00210EF584|nr:hypothetical protein [Bacillus sp. V3B]MCQ6274267.1 hypothetical protein [Bacillus sp. V3B]
MFYSITILLSIIFVFIYRRYVPVLGVPCIRSLNKDGDLIKVVDVRDYNLSYKDPIQGSINIPVAYLKRNFHEVSNSKIIVVASNRLEKNISIRFLKNKGCKVMGYTLTDCICTQEVKQKTA